MPDAVASHHILAARSWRRRWLVGLGSLGGLVLVLAALTIAASVGGRSGSSHRSTPSYGVHPQITTPLSTTAPGAPGASPVPLGGGPTILSLTPLKASFGQVVIISGANLFSADGQILAHFGSQVASTSCPTQNSCTVTVPAPSGATARVLVTVSTQAGTSNGLWFAYQ